MTRPMGWFGLGVLATVVAGCGNPAPAPLRPQEFVAENRPGMEPGILNRQTDQNGTLVYGTLHAPLLPDEYSDDPSRKAPIHISRIVREATSQPVASVPSTEPATMPTSRIAPGVASNYQIVGTVIATVNGHPIYADKVIADIETQLAAKARELDPDAFKVQAAQAIGDRVRAIQKDESTVAAANEFLSTDAKNQAEMYATYFRSQQITAAGGSLEAAKEKALRMDGKTLDEEVRDARDKFLVQLYLEQRVIPLIQVTASDMRRYYEQNLASEFTQTAAAKFHLIKIDIAGRGGPEPANDLAHKILSQLHGGKDFSQLAKEYNDDPTLMRSGGAVADGNWVQKGSYVNELVENEVWKLHPGEITDPAIPDRQSARPAYYIAQLDAKKPGTVKRFDDQDVQEQIFNTLRNRQFALILDKLMAKLAEQSFAPIRQDSLEAALEMAMQKYAAWRDEQAK